MADGEAIMMAVETPDSPDEAQSAEVSGDDDFDAPVRGAPARHSGS